MRIIDISWPITQDMTAYKNRSVVAFKKVKDFYIDGARESIITLGSHTGTHVDAPAHFLEHGATLDAFSLSCLVGPCMVVDMTHCTDYIAQKDFESITDMCITGSIILCKTKNSDCLPTSQFDDSFVYIHKDAALYLADKGIRAVGIDYLGIERNQKEHETHRVLMKKDILIIEGLRLKDVNPGSYFLCCLPLAVAGIDASPARAILIVW